MMPACWAGFSAHMFAIEENMQVYRLRLGGKACRSGAAACVIGNFDGVHLGHQQLIDQLVNISKQRNLISAVMLFEPQPIEFLRPDQAPTRLMSWREKAETLSKLGVCTIYLVKFNTDFSLLDSRGFVESFLVNQCNVRHLIVGDDFRFGRNRSGGVSELEALGREFDLRVDQSSTLLVGRERVSSTRIRQILQEGDFDKAQDLIGRSFEISGKVVYGDGLGKQLGFPTANIQLNQPGLPVKGVFAVTVTDQSGQALVQEPAVANLGFRPTVSGRQRRCEVHLLRQDALNLYGQRLRIRFISRLRDEKAFASLESLKQAIAQDIDMAKNLFDQR